ncbi:PilZ domain-containing protein [Novosphingobium sp. MMS21-SN21R]|uniref:PilZ domain-containing protein n=1 Tax=Novosphingobium sp. MMS21-SN21R TaxID=2969298 RepID=UPI002884127E|nr:PilZ domain-containing protein [Novosphingobium sp. MMS21-SN21R]MDT0508836.1 PilZ domain-containing protein [Novosphingobium sp. MMS21-SN21R]
MPGKPFIPSAHQPSTVRPGRRAESRVRLHIPARLILLTGVVNCMLEDLSVTGAALIPQGELPPVDASGILQCEGLEVFGVIRWARYGRCGMLFDERLPLANVISMRHIADAYEHNERERFRQSAKAWVQGGIRHL